MIENKLVACSVLAIALTAVPTARAQVAQPASATMPAPSPEPPPQQPATDPVGTASPEQPPATPMPAAMPPPVDPEEQARWERARFSGGRWVVEMLAGAALGTLAAYGVYTAAGEGVGGAFAGIATGFVVTPLVEWGVGRAMGGQGSLTSSYLGGLIGFSGAAPATQGGEILVLAIAQVLCPITSGLFFEFSSNARARTWQMQHGLTLTVAPLGRGGDGAAVGAALRW